MSRRPRLSRTAVAQAGLAVAVLLAAGWLVWWLADTAPTAELEVGLPGAIDPAEPPTTFVSCEDPLAADGRYADGREPANVPTPVGRIRSDVVVECPRHFDGVPVEYVGEVVGDVLVRPGGAWTLVNDDAYGLEDGPLHVHRRPGGVNTGLAVWLPGSGLRDSVTPGRSEVRGDVVRVIGVLHRTDPEDGGGLTVRAVSWEVVEPAEVISPPLHVGQAGTALVLLLVVGGLFTVERRRRSG